MQEELENKSVTLIINTSKLTARTLATGFMKFLRFSWNKTKEHHYAKPQGKQSVQELIGQNQGVEKTELADKDEAKTFDKFARKYGVDYAVRKGVSEDGKPRYVLFFKARDRAAIEQAMAAYAADWKMTHKRERPPVEQVLDPLKELVSDRKKERIKQKGLER